MSQRKKSITCTTGTDGKDYYFRNGKRIKNKDGEKSIPKSKCKKKSLSKTKKIVVKKNKKLMFNKKFENLPFEMVYTICEQMDVHTLSNFVRTNNEYRELCNPILQRKKSELLVEPYPIIKSFIENSNNKIYTFFTISRITKVSVSVSEVDYYINSGKIYPLSINKHGFHKKFQKKKYYRLVYTKSSYVAKFRVKEFVREHEDDDVIYEYIFTPQISNDSDKIMFEFFQKEGFTRYIFSKEIIKKIKNKKVRSLPLWLEKPTKESILYWAFGIKE